MINRNNQVKALIKQFSLDDRATTRDGLDKIFQSPDTSLRRRKLLSLIQKQPEVYEATKDIADGLERVESLLSLILQPKIENPSVYFNHPELYDPLYLIDLVDDFIAGSTENGEIGDLGWTAGSGALTITASTPTHPGIITITSAASAAAYGRVHLGSGNADYIIHSADVNRLVALIRLNFATQAQYRFGIGTAPNSTTYGTDSIYFNATFAGAVANWHCICRAAGTPTDVDSGVLANINVWWKLEIIQRDDGEVDFWINNDLVASINTNVPSAAMEIIFNAYAVVAAARSMDIDYFRIQLKKLTDNIDARWP